MSKRTKNNPKPTAAAKAIIDARREGQYVRTKTWSANGERKCPKVARRKAKRAIRERY